MGDGRLIWELVAVTPGAIQKSTMTVGAMAEEEEVFRQIQRQNSTTNTSNLDTAKSKK